MAERLADILIGLNTEFSQAIRNCRLISLWDQVVDERVKKHTDPVKIKNKTLYISTSTSIWAQELSFLKRDIVKKFNEKAGEEAISDIRFKSTGVQ